MNEKKLTSWLHLNYIPLLSSLKTKQLLEALGNPCDWIYNYKDIPNYQAVFSDTQQRYLNNINNDAIAKDLDFLESDNTDILYLTHEDYPTRLAQINDAPVILYTRGNTSLLSHPQVAVIGSRNPDRSALAQTRTMASTLASYGFTITSGLAVGIDGAAHQAALEYDASTVAVLGTGIDRIYPAKHRDLAHQIAQKGVLISEFSLGTAPLRHNFPRRNRIVSGLSVGVLVVQAALKSGTKITARLALEQDREVFAVPGSIYNPLSKGCHDLIKQGAKLVEDANDILEELGMMVIRQKENNNDTTLAKKTNSLLNVMGFDPISIDEIVQITGKTTQNVTVDIMELEIEGRIELVNSGKYQQIN